MTETISKNWKKFTAIFVGIGLLGMSVGSIAPAAFGGGGFFVQPCDSGNGNVEHWDKIIFTNSVTFKNQGLEELISKNQLLDIKVLDDPGAVADLEQKLVDFLTSTGWTRAGGGSIGKQHVAIDDVEYAIICVSFSSNGL